MTDLIDTTEMYLRTIFELEEEGVPALRARIAERLGHSGPTVSQTVARMERDGLLSVGADRAIELSVEGRLRATRVMRKHRLAERLLIDVIGLEYEYVHAEACRWEHVISERVERKIVALLADYESSPYGNPIPGLAELGVVELGAVEPDSGGEGELSDQASARRTSVVRAGLVQLVELNPQQPCTVVLRRLGEPLQEDSEALGLLRAAGLCPGERITVRRDGSRFVLSRLPGGDGDGRSADEAEGDGVSLPEEFAAQVFVSLPRGHVDGS